MTNAQIDDAAFGHPALFYRTQQEYLDCLLPFITDGLDAGQPVLVAVPGPNLARLRDGLGPRAADVVMTDMTDAGRNPGRILGEVLGNFVEKHRTEWVRMIGEPICPARSELEYPACVQHEALINRAFAGRSLTMVCPYDAVHLDPNVIADARSTHPVLWEAGSSSLDNPAYSPDAVWARYNQRLSSHAAAVRYTAKMLTDLSGARAFAAETAKWFGLSGDRTADLQLIANELATASLMHAGTACQLAIWLNDGHLVCEARDGGCLDDPLVGRRPYHHETGRGRGMYVVNAVADLVRVHTAPGETTVHAYLRLEAET